jgi:hypothetical protein
MRKLQGAVVVLIVVTASFTALAGAARSSRTANLIAYQVRLGSAVATGYAQGISQSPTTNDVFYSEGAKVLVVKGHAAPVHFATAPAAVLATCATASALYVETAKAIRKYTLPGGSFVGTWALPSNLGPAKVTSAGLADVGDHLWSWTDWATDESGYEYGSVVEFNTTTWSSRVLDREMVDPSDAAADAIGYFFLAGDRVVRVEPSGKVLESSKSPDNSDAPVAAMGGSVFLVTIRSNDRYYLDTYRASTMTRSSSVVVHATTYGLLGTANGLLGIHAGTGHTATTVVTINPTSGAETHAVSASGATVLLDGTTVSVVAVIHGEMYLDRLG